MCRCRKRNNIPTEMRPGGCRTPARTRKHIQQTHTAPHTAHTETPTHQRETQHIHIELTHKDRAPCEQVLVNAEGRERFDIRRCPPGEKETKEKKKRERR